VLALDNNEELTKESGTFLPLKYSPSHHTTNRQHDGSLATLIKTCNLIVIATVQHLHLPPPATYNRGKQRLDYILVSNSISHAVVQSGILPYYSIFQGDHRPCFIDLDATALFQEGTHAVAPMTQRGLQLADPKIVTKYIKIIKTQLEYHNKEEKRELLWAKVREGTWDYNDQLEYKKIDQITSESALHAEREVKRKFTKTYEWSPKLIQAVQGVQYWKLQLKKVKGLHVTEHILLITLISATFLNQQPMTSYLCQSF
jgi:hypothetical protein